MAKQADNAEETIMYRWICPVCDVSNVGFAGQENPRTSALKAIQSHIRAEHGDGHGVEYEIPGKWTTETLDPHIDVFGTEDNDLG